MVLVCYVDGGGIAVDWCANLRTTLGRSDGRGLNTAEVSARSRSLNAFDEDVERCLIY